MLNCCYRGMLDIVLQSGSAEGRKKSRGRPVIRPSREGIVQSSNYPSHKTNDSSKTRIAKVIQLEPFIAGAHD